MLLVEDDRDVRESLTEVLESEGHAVVPARNGREGLWALDHPGSSTLVLLDLRMPGMDGGGFLEAIRARPDGGRYRVILMSADRSVTALRDVPGVVAVLDKPFDFSELLGLLARHAG